MKFRHVLFFCVVPLMLGGATECDFDREVGRTVDDGGGDGGAMDDVSPDGGEGAGDADPAETDTDDGDAEVIDSDLPEILISASESQVVVQFRDRISSESACLGDVMERRIDGFGDCEVNAVEPCTEPDVDPIEFYYMGPGVVSVGIDGSAPVTAEYADNSYVVIFDEMLPGGTPLWVRIELPDLPPIERHVTVPPLSITSPTLIDLGATSLYLEHELGSDLAVEWDTSDDDAGSVVTLELLSGRYEDATQGYVIRCIGPHDAGGFVVPWTVLDTYVMGIGDWCPSLDIMRSLVDEESVAGTNVTTSSWSRTMVTMEMVDTSH